jgi:integrase
MKATKLPSGNWRCRAYDNKTKKCKSFTAPTKKEAEYLAAEWLNDKNQKRSLSRETVAQCVRNYIESKENILSPSSIRGYLIILNNSINEIENININDLTERDLQSWVNSNASRYKPKSVKSQYGLVTAALRQAKIMLDFNSVLLPRIPKSEKKIPNEKEVALILEMVEGTSVELPVTIAVTLGLRQSEIAALKWSDYDGQVLDIHAAVVPDKHSKFVYKNTTKSQASTRKIEVDGLLKERLDRAEHTGEFISPMLPSSVLRKFNHLCDKNGLPRYTMHEQRHGNASMMLAMGVPDKYAMKRLGQSSPSMVKEIYQHLYEDKEKEVAKTMSATYENLYRKKKNT